MATNHVSTIEMVIVQMIVNMATNHRETVRRMIAVSYTHLDVYKRQLFCLPMIPVFLNKKTQLSLCLSWRLLGLEMGIEPTTC